MQLVNSPPDVSRSHRSPSRGNQQGLPMRQGFGAEESRSVADNLSFRDAVASEGNAPSSRASAFAPCTTIRH
jgi:hypothetical protein